MHQHPPMKLLGYLVRLARCSSLPRGWSGDVSTALRLVVVRRRRSAE
jgi:hypothetical protein